jgi:signal transduction histidine kinase
MQRLQSEKEKQVVKALLDGEEKERRRIAQELHDGINGNLAALKLNLKPDEKHQTIVLLDQTMNEVRMISHNLMPDAVKKFGLKEALENYISGMNDTDTISIHFQHLGNENNLDDELSVNIYRIVQELVKNSLKHAGASEILVQITSGLDNMQITVEDDGKGFDAGALKSTPSKKAGIGLANIENRVSYHQGSFDIRSSTHEGTSINIEIPLQKTKLA